MSDAVITLRHYECSSLSFLACLANRACAACPVRSARFARRLPCPLCLHVLMLVHASGFALVATNDVT